MTSFPTEPPKFPFGPRGEEEKTMLQLRCLLRKVAVFLSSVRGSHNCFERLFFLDFFFNSHVLLN